MLPVIFCRGLASVEARGASRFVYSWNSLHPFSFLIGAESKIPHLNGKLKVPSPNFMDIERLITKPSLTKESILEGMVINDKIGLVLVDKHICSKFKGIVSNMISQMLSAIFMGKPISLLVRLFEPKSTLQRITDYWSFAPIFLKQAVNNNPLERMKKVITFAVAGLYIPTKQLKPFNPMIGETFQGKFENGMFVYVEHISHYPTMSQFYLKDDDICIHGYFDFTTGNEGLGKRIIVHQKGPINVDFDSGRVTYNMPTIKLLNAKSEENRSAIWVDYMIFVDIRNNLKGVIQMGHDSNKIHGVSGYICEYNYPPNYKYNIDNELKEAKKGPGKNKILSNIDGSWLYNLTFDNEEYWNINKYEPGWIRPIRNALPSDGRFREDLIWLYRSFYDAADEQERKLFEDYAQEWKVAMEIIQRAEREIRKKSKKHK
jgi:hypothetical protein